MFRFVLDEPDAQTLQEQLEHRDILFLNVTQNGQARGFGQKFLLMANWAVINFQFQYLLRVDDDNFLCLNHILHDLETLGRPSSLIWGWWAFPGANSPKGGPESEWAGQVCDKILSSSANAVRGWRPDEMGFLVSANLVHYVASAYVELHKWDLMDMSLVKWLYAVKATYVVDNIRFMRGNYTYGPQHNPHTRSGIALSNFCTAYISYHKSHPQVMRDIWSAGSREHQSYAPLHIHKNCVQNSPKFSESWSTSASEMIS